MVINWDYVKEQTLWSYEDLIKKLYQSLNYPFVQKHYHHNMSEAIDYVNEVHAGYFQHRSDRTWIDSLITTFGWLKRVGIQNYLDLVQQVDNRDKCETFLRESGLGFPELIELLSYLLRWVLPFPAPLREFFDMEDQVEMAYFHTLKAQEITTNLDLLERGRTLQRRTQLSELTGIPIDFLLPLIHKADMARLAYVRGKTVRHLCGGGYDTLAKLADADLKEMEAAMSLYYQALGKQAKDFRAVMQLAPLVGGARILPAVVED